MLEQAEELIRAGESAKACRLLDPLLARALGQGSWPLVLGGVMIVLLLDGVVCRMQKPNTFSLRVVLSRGVAGLFFSKAQK